MNEQLYIICWGYRTPGGITGQGTRPVSKGGGESFVRLFEGKYPFMYHYLMPV